MISSIIIIFSPEGVIPDVSHFDTYSKRTTTECQTSMPVYCSEDEVVKVSKILGGCAGLTGVDGIMLRGWVLRKGVPSEKFREEIARWVMLLSNESPTYAMYRALNSSRILPADKKLA